MPTGKQDLPGPLSVAVGEILHKARVASGATQVAIARAAGMSETQLSRALRGLKPLSLDQFESICIALGLDVVKVLSQADVTTRAKRPPATVTRLRPKTATPKPPLRRVAKKRSKDRGGDDGQG